MSLRDRIAAVIQENLVWEAPNMSVRLADAVVGLLIDMAGHGELLQSIRQHEPQPMKEKT